MDYCPKAVPSRKRGAAEQHAFMEIVMSYTIITNGLPNVVTHQWYITQSDDPDDPRVSGPINIPESVQKFLLDKERGTFEARQDVIHPDGFLSGWATHESGDPTPPPPRDVSLRIDTRKPTPEWRKRFAKGEIVLNPLTNTTCTLKVFPGNPTLSSEYIETRYYQVGEEYGNIPFLGIIHRGNSSGDLRRYFCTAPGFERYFIFHGSGYLRRPVYRKVKSLTELPEPVVLNEFYRKVMDQLTVDKSLVTGVLAGANKKSLDILTAIAETPETITSVLDGFKSVVKIVKDFRSRNFSIVKSFRAEHGKRVRDFLSRYNDLSVKIDMTSNPAKKRRLIRVRETLAKEFSRRTNSAIAEANSAVSDLWLSFRYAIMPNVYLINDILEAQSAALSAYGTSRDRSTVNDVQLPEYAGWSLDKSIEITHRSMCKRRYAADTSLARGIPSTLSWNIPVTIWELMPYSFVIDWFVNVGDLLSALFGMDFYLEQGQTYSWRVNVSATYTSTNGVKAMYSINGYRRDIINPNDYVGLCVEPDINLKRAIDSVALSWAPIKRYLLSQKG